MTNTFLRYPFREIDFFKIYVLLKRCSSRLTALKLVDLNAALESTLFHDQRRGSRQRLEFNGELSNDCQPTQW